MANTRKVGGAPLLGGHDNYWARKNEALRNIENLGQNDQIIAHLRWQSDEMRTQTTLLARQVELLEYLADMAHRQEAGSA